MSQSLSTNPNLSRTPVNGKQRKRQDVY